MKTHAKRYRRRSPRRRAEEGAPVSQAEPARASPALAPERLGPQYRLGPVHGLPAGEEQEQPGAAAQAVLKPGMEAAPIAEQAAPGASPDAAPQASLADQATPEAAPASAAQEEAALSELGGPAGGAAPGKEASPESAAGPAPAKEETPQAVLIPSLTGRGEPVGVSAFNQRGPLRLQGRTDATYDGGQFHTENVTVRKATKCDGCEGTDCVRATGTLVATYSVATTITLPSVSDFPDLTPCQQRRVQQAIDNILAPHEREHVQRFRQYNGTTRRAFDLTVCRAGFDGAIQSMFEAEESARRQAAQAASDALDPFHFDVDLDCEEPQRRTAEPNLDVPPAAAVY